MRVALRRAAHQILDAPRVFDDPLALRILGVEDAANLQPKPEWLKETPISRVLRGSMAARSRFAEDELHKAVKRGVIQYVDLGAGLNTFAYRNPYESLRVFEVDYPATQAFKRKCLEESGIHIPPTLNFAPIDFEAETLEQGLRRAGFDAGKSTFFSWLGVTPYLTENAIDATLKFVTSMPMGSGIVFDYMILPSLLSPMGKRAFDSLSLFVAQAGEPFQSFFDPSCLKASLLVMGFLYVENIEPEEMNARYFMGRTDGLRTGSLAHVINAIV